MESSQAEEYSGVKAEEVEEAESSAGENAGTSSGFEAAD